MADFPVMTLGLWIHIGFILLGFGTFMLSLLGALLYFYIEMKLKSSSFAEISTPWPSLETLDRWISQLVTFGFVCLTTGMVIGANLLWRQMRILQVPDLKLILAGTTWALFFLYLLLRHGWKWRGRQTNYLIMVGFAFLFLTYLTATLGIHLSVLIR